MSKQLPPHPSVEQLKKQAKDLRQAHRSGKAGAMARLRAHLPRLAQASDEQIRAAEVGLQEAQHVIAGEYGFKKWNWLLAVAGNDFDLLARLTDREIQTLLREIDQKDLVIALKGASDPAKEKFLGNMSARVRTFIAEEMEFLGPLPSDEVEAMQRRVLMQVARIVAEGQIDWPDSNGVAAREEGAPVFTHSPRLLELAGRPLDALSLDEVVELWWELAEQARREGILSLEPVAARAADPFVREAVRLAVDGTEPDLIVDILKTRSERAMLPQQDTRERMVIEALMAIQAGDNPRIIRHKMSTFYEVVPSEEDSGSGKVTVEELAGRLRKTPLARMAFGQIAELFTDMGELARREGIDALKPLLKVVDRPLLKRGLEMVLDSRKPGEIIAALERQLDEELRQAGTRQRMVIAGIAAVQMGTRPDVVEAKVREAAQG